MIEISLEEVVPKYANLVRRSLQRLGCAAVDLEDRTQDVWLMLCVRWSTLRFETFQKLENFLRTLAKNCYLNCVNSLATKNAALTVSLDELNDIERTPGPLPTGFIEFSEQMQPLQREALEYKLQGFTEKETAERLRVSQSTINRLLKNIRKCE